MDTRASEFYAQLKFDLITALNAYLMQTNMPKFQLAHRGSDRDVSDKHPRTELAMKSEHTLIFLAVRTAFVTL